MLIFYFASYIFDIYLRNLNIWLIYFPNLTVILFCSVHLDENLEKHIKGFGEIHFDGKAR